MPELNTDTPTTTTTTIVNATAQAPESTQSDVRMVTGKLRRERGRAVLLLDVSKLHEYLEFLNVPKEATYKRFSNAPASRADVVDNVNHAIVPKSLCSFDYNTKNAAGEVVPGILEIDLLRHYATPPTEPTLRAIAESVKDAAVAVVTHYQPVEISITVVGKKAK